MTRSTGIAVVVNAITIRHAQRAPTPGADDDAAKLAGLPLRFLPWPTILARLYFDHTLPEFIGPCRLMFALDQLT